MRFIIRDVNLDDVESAYVERPLDEACDRLTARGYEIISLAQNAALRIRQGERNTFSNISNFVREGVIYRPNNTSKLVSFSPLIFSQHAIWTDYHREYYVRADVIEEALKSSVDFPDEEIKIPSKRLGSHELTVFAFGGEKPAQAYGDFLNSAGINELPILPFNDKSYVDRMPHPFVNQLWFEGLNSFCGALHGRRALEWYDGFRRRSLSQPVRGIRFPKQ